MTVFASLVAALGAGLAVATVRSRGAPRASGTPAATVVGGVFVLGALVVASIPLVTLVLWSGVACGLWCAARLVRHRRELVRAQQRSAQVLLACESLAGDLGVGLAQRPALERVAREWPEFAPVAAAARLDADVPSELRRLALLPGAGELAGLAAAWQVSHRSGAALAPTLAAVTTVIRADAVTGRLVETELAAARATAGLLVVLPAGVLLLGQGIGARPWHFLTGSPLGVGCAVVGAALDLLGVWWLQRIAARVLRS